MPFGQGPCFLPCPLSSVRGAQMTADKDKDKDLIRFWGDTCVNESFPMPLRWVVCSIYVRGQSLPGARLGDFLGQGVGTAWGRG